LKHNTFILYRVLSRELALQFFESIDVEGLSLLQDLLLYVFNFVVGIKFLEELVCLFGGAIDAVVEKQYQHTESLENIDVAQVSLGLGGD
jgi:hypothetical protein